MDAIQIRNFRDFVLLYNQISDTCFRRCTNTFNTRQVTEDEEICLKNCVEKHINANQKTMEIFLEVQPIFVQKRVDEMNRLQTALEAQQETAAATATATANA